MRPYYRPYHVEVVEFENNYVQPSSLLDLSEEEKEFVLTARQGGSILHRCTIGLMVRPVLKKRRLHLEVPVENPEIRGEAEAEHVRAVIASWSGRLAEYDKSKQAQKPPVKA